MKSNQIRNLMRQVFRPVSDIPQRDVERACDRVLERLQEQPEGTRVLARAHVLDALDERDAAREALAGALRAVGAVSARGRTDPVVSQPVSSRDRRAVSAGPRSPTRPWALAVAVALVVVAVGGAIVWPRGVRVYAAGNDGRQVTLADDSRVEMRAHSEMAVGRASDGIQIDLKTGDIIVTAAKQRHGYLYVRTNDMTVTVGGTVFMANAGRQGSRVAVIEGEVRLREGDVETRLRPGEQVATSPTIARRTLTEDIAWSRHADAHLAILESFTRGLAQTAGPLRPVARVQDVPGAGAQASPQFQEASVRTCDPDNLPAPPPDGRGGGANSFQMTPGRTHALCMTLATIIRHAYGYGPAELEFRNPGRRGRGLNVNIVYGLGVEDGVRVRGGPDWVRSERYTIDAVADGAADGPTMSGPMLRDLLERRFQLKVHIETEQIPAFTLTVAGGGLKVKPARPDSCVSFPVDPSAPRARSSPPLPIGVRRPSLADIRRGEKRLCGQFGERNGPNWVFVAGGATFSELAQQLAERVGAVSVFDKTGITDKFDWILEFARDEKTRGPAGETQLVPEPLGVSRGPTIFAALEEQLGLRLEPARTPREFIVIDQVARPAAN